MNPKARLLAVVAAAVVAAVCVMGACSRKPAAPPLGIDAQLAAMVPREATILGGFRMDRIRTSPLYEEYFRGRLPMGGDTARGLMQFQEQIDEVLVAVVERDSLVLVKGRLDKAAVEAKLREGNAPAATVGGKPGFEQNGVAVVLLDGGYALAGPRARVEDALTRMGKNVVLPARFFQTAQSMPAASHLWVISVGRLPVLELPERSNLANLPRALENVELAKMNADLSNGFKMSAAATCTTEPDAKQIHTLLRGVIGMARLSTPSDKPELMKVFDRIQIAQKERVVTLEASLPPEMIDELAGTFGLRERVRPREAR
ncbi:MAG: hypothetical protein J0L64_19620 [Acidobacteria bacterium]|nr:hypothetical protein [Acidobacteriota bacterium]